MSHHDHSKSSFYFASPSPHTCPMCGQVGLLRIRRRFVDRILSLFIKQRRYRCTQPGCQWQGNLREKREHTRTHGSNKHVPTP